MIEIWRQNQSNNSYSINNSLFGYIFSNLEDLFSLKVSGAAYGLLAKALNSNYEIQ
jgi:hypothetical protein